MSHKPNHVRGHLAELYAERRRHREDVAELKHQLHRAHIQMALTQSTLEALQQLHRAAADMAISERQEVIRLSGLVADLRAQVLALTAPIKLGPQDDCGYQPGPVS